MQVNLHLKKLMQKNYPRNLVVCEDNQHLDR